MRHALKTIAIAAAIGAASLGSRSLCAAASPAAASKTLIEVQAPGVAEPISFRRGHWRDGTPCRKGGRFYTYRGGWGCDYYLYGLWPARPPRRW